MNKQDVLLETRTMVIPDWMKPAKKPTFNRGSINDAVTAAARAALAHGRDYWICAVYGGYIVDFRAPSLPPMQKYYRLTIENKTIKVMVYQTA